MTNNFHEFLLNLIMYTFYLQNKICICFVNLGHLLFLVSKIPNFYDKKFLYLHKCGSVLVVAPQTTPPPQVCKILIRGTLTLGLLYTSERGPSPPPFKNVKKSPLLKLLKLCRTTWSCIFLPWVVGPLS